MSTKSNQRLFLVSDIHVDAIENWRWIERLSTTAYQTDALIVAGDVSESLERLETTLKLLAAKFALVFFTPGNHDLWVEEEGSNSMVKLQQIFVLCDRLGVATRPCRFGDGDCGIWVCPLLSFHHQRFDQEPDVQGWAIPTVVETMVDYRACSWPAGLSMLDDSVAAAMDAANDAHWSDELLTQRPSSEPLVTFSHFLPREELLPEKRFLFLPVLPKAAGSTFLGRRVASLRPTMHCFGRAAVGSEPTQAVEAPPVACYVAWCLSSPWAAA